MSGSAIELKRRAIAGRPVAGGSPSKARSYRSGPEAGKERINGPA